MKKYLLPLALIITTLSGLVFVSSTVGQSQQPFGQNGVTNFRLGIRLSDRGCSQYLSRIALTGDLNSGGGNSTFITDSANTIFDCMQIKLEPDPSGKQVAGKDFRACLQLASALGVDSNGNAVGLDGVGSKACSPWATEGNGNAWAYTSYAGDPTAAQIILETRPIPSTATRIPNNVRYAIQAADNEGTLCQRDFGDGKWTGWARNPLLTGSGNNPWSGWATSRDGHNPACWAIYSEITSSNVSNTQAPPQCSDAIDNDGDGAVDHPADTNCDSPSDPTESVIPPDPNQNNNNNGNGNGNNNNNPPNPNASITCTLSASPTSISPTGNATLAWNCTNAAGNPAPGNVVISDDNTELPDIGSQATQGSKKTSPKKTTTFVLPYPALAPITFTLRVSDSIIDEVIP